MKDLKEGAGVGFCLGFASVLKLELKLLRFVEVFSSYWSFLLRLVLLLEYQQKALSQPTWASKLLKNEKVLIRFSGYLYFSRYLIANPSLF